MATAGHARNLGLDVVRALAIGLVLTCHYGWLFCYWAGGRAPLSLEMAGFFGVELFFVLSGFLIGRLLSEIAATRPTGRQLLIFLIRRWMRTLPLYFAWLALLALFLPPRTEFLPHLLRYATLTQNLFGGMPSDEWFGVSWSLTIEEWFYLLFGAGAVGCAALFGSRRAVWVPIVVFLVVPPVLRWMAPDSAGLDSVLRKAVVLRLDAIAYGVAMAELSLRNSRLLRYPGALLAAGVLLILIVWTNQLMLPAHLFRVLVFNVTSLGFVLCLPAALRLRDAWAWLAIPVRMLSAQSYGLYIMHFTVLELVGFLFVDLHRIGYPAALGLSILVPFVLSYVSYHFFEAPILALRPRQRLRPGADVPVPAAGPGLGPMKDPVGA